MTVFSIFSSNIIFIILGISVVVMGFLFFYRLRNQEEARNQVAMNDKPFEKKGVDINLKMQAYERLTIFLERTDPWRLLSVIDKTEKNIENIESNILNVLLSEFEYNLSQQVYVSDELWDMIVASKNQTINLISSVKNSLKRNSKGEDFFNSLKLILQNQQLTPAKIALDYLKQEVRSI